MGSARFPVGIGQTQNEKCASKVNVERGASGSSGWAGRVGREPRAQSRGDWRRPGRADGRAVWSTLDLTRPDPDPHPARRVGCRLRTRVSNANVEVFEPRPGPREGAEARLFSAGRANNRAWRRRASRESKTGRERLFASSSFPAMGDSTKNSPLQARARLPRAAAQRSPWCESGVRCGLPDGTFARNRSSDDAVRCSNWARKVRSGTSRVKIREDRVDAALVASRTGVRRGGVLQKHPAITGFTTGRGDRMAQRHVLERGRLNACAASAGVGTRTYGHYEVSCSRSADDDG